MKKVIYKYPLKYVDVQNVVLPKNAHLLQAHQKGFDDNLFLWALVDPDEKETIGVEVHVLGTAHEYDTDNLLYRILIE